VVRALHGNTYQQLESALQLQRFHDELRTWHTKYGTGPLAADREFDQHLQNRYAVTADHNAQVNRTRAGYLFLTNRRIILAAMLAGAALVPFAANIQLNPEPVQHFKLVDPITCTLTVAKRGNTMAPPQTPDIPPPPKPLPSPIQNIVEGQIPKGPRPSR
jgi:hypothetical protein